MAVGTNKSKGNAPKKPAKGAVNWEILEHMDGNAVTAAEFDRDSANDRKYFFVAGEEASEDDVTKCMVLNYIHCRLRSKSIISLDALSIEQFFVCGCQARQSLLGFEASFMRYSTSSRIHPRL